MEGDVSLHAVHKVKYRFAYRDRRFEIDIYPFSAERAIMRAALPAPEEAVDAPHEIRILREVTNDPAYRNTQLARNQVL